MIFNLQSRECFRDTYNMSNITHVTRLFDRFLKRYFNRSETVEVNLSLDIKHDKKENKLNRKSRAMY